MNHPWLRSRSAWKRDVRRMERLIDELPHYLDDLPREAGEEIVLRVRRVGVRIDDFVRLLGSQK